MTATLVRDALGREFTDDLARLLSWVQGEQGCPLWPPVSSHVAWMDGVATGAVYRNGQFQIECCIVSPNKFITPHVHPDVDSFEVALAGMAFWHMNRPVVTLAEVGRARADGVSPFAFGCIRVERDEVHHGQAGPEGGLFLSVQRWASWRKPTTIADCWVGETMGPLHAARADPPAPASWRVAPWWQRAQAHLAAFLRGA